jgi:hypothetical protein
MKIDRNHALNRRSPEQIGDKARSDRLAAGCSAILPRIPEVGDYSSQTAGACAPASVREHHQLEQMLIRGGTSWLKQVHITLAHAILKLDMKLAVRKTLQDASAKRKLKPPGDCGCQRGISRARENYRIHRFQLRS